MGGKLALIDLCKTCPAVVILTGHWMSVLIDTNEAEGIFTQQMKTCRSSSNDVNVDVISVLGGVWIWTEDWNLEESLRIGVEQVSLHGTGEICAVGGLIFLVRSRTESLTPWGCHPASANVPDPHVPRQHFTDVSENQVL